MGIIRNEGHSSRGFQWSAPRAAVSCGVALALVVAGCGSDSESVTPKAPEDETTLAAESAEETTTTAPPESSTTTETTAAEPDEPTDLETGRITGQFHPVEPGTYDVDNLGTPFSVTLEGDWWVQPNIPGHIVFSDPASLAPGDKDVAIFRVNFLADPLQPQAALDEQDVWPVDDIQGWLDNVIDGVILSEPTEVELGGRTALYFEAAVEADICPDASTNSYCVGFVINTAESASSLSGWAFEPGTYQRIYWIDEGDEAPIVIIIGTNVGFDDFVAPAEALLDTIQFGETQPHPSPQAELPIG